MSGRVVHFEIPVDDAERAEAFYREAFAWELTSLSGMDYVLAITGPTGDEGPTEPGFVNGGLLRRTGDLGIPVMVIDVADIDAALVKIEELGGQTVVGRQQVGDLGWTAYFKDVEGNSLGLWQSA
jgi:predicted enzyme related to lactoylglutathione lyase